MQRIMRDNIINTYINYFNYKNYRFLLQQNKTIILRTGKAVATLNVSDKSIIIGTTLYDAQENKLIEIDLKDVLY